MKIANILAGVVAAVSVLLVQHGVNIEQVIHDSATFLLWFFFGAYSLQFVEYLVSEAIARCRPQPFFRKGVDYDKH